MMTACDVKDTIYETPHPEQGQITLTTDWSATNIPAPPSAGYTVKVGDYSATLTGTTNTVNTLFDPGDYTIYAYNTADGITVSGTTATVAATRSNVSAQPGWFYTGVKAVTVTKDTDHEFTVAMKQQIVEQTFRMTPSGGSTDRIESITATLEGIAGTMDIGTNQRSGSSTVALTFTKQSDGTWQTTIRVLGVVGSLQPLTTTVTFSDSVPETITDTTDINGYLNSSFDSDGSPHSGISSIDLGADLVVTPTETGFTATITDWTVITENIEVDKQ